MPSKGSFGVTYEGLKLHGVEVVIFRPYGFGVTYEGLKLRYENEYEDQEIAVLELPMRV